jgi:hypothetical protein
MDAQTISLGQHENGSEMTHDTAGLRTERSSRLQQEHAVVLNSEMSIARWISGQLSAEDAHEDV